MVLKDWFICVALRFQMSIGQTYFLMLSCLVRNGWNTLDNWTSGSAIFIYSQNKNNRRLAARVKMLVLQASAPWTTTCSTVPLDLSPINLISVTRGRPASRLHHLQHLNFGFD